MMRLDPLNLPQKLLDMQPTRKEVLWLVAMSQDPLADPQQAAIKAGYKAWRQASIRLIATFKAVLAELAQETGVPCTLDELKILGAEIARNRQHKDQASMVKILLQLEGGFNPELWRKRNRREQEEELNKLRNLILPGFKKVGRLPADRAVEGVTSDKVLDVPPEDVREVADSEEDEPSSF